MEREQGQMVVGSGRIERLRRSDVSLGSPTDARVRQNEKWGGQWMVVTDSRGLAAIIPYPKANGKKWG
ncbi:hypothetical protein LJK88_26190 [Paenibacillus sp. P26]|nr:hypothetical protein LJK88_26190 [Paenibacillus sp. P26]